jgi:hypothetical protein
LQFSLVALGDLTPKDDGNFVGLADGPIGVQESNSEMIQRCSAMKDQNVTILHLGKEKPVLATGSVAFARFEKWRQLG